MSPAPSPPPPPQPASTPAVRHKQRPHPVGIAAGAEDAKYQAKYKELKRKVKDIENHNEKLHFKLLQARLGVRRMKMERAILYERLSAVPPEPLPPHPQSSRSMPHNSHPPPPLDLDQAPNQYIHPHQRLDSRPLPVMDNSSVASSPHVSRHHVPPPNQLPVHQYEMSRAPSSHASPPINPPPASSHSRSRSHSSSYPVPPPPPAAQSYRSGNSHHQYPESLPVGHPSHSPPLPDRERPPRRDNEYDPHPYDRHTPHAQQSPRPQPPSTTDPRASSGRIHGHQRMGPGTYMNRDDFHEKQRERDFEREREWERDHPSKLPPGQMHSPHRTRSQNEYEHHPASYPPPGHQDVHGPPSLHPYPSRLSRANTPGSGSASGSGAGGLEDSHYYNSDRARSSYKVRPASHEDSQVQGPPGERGYDPPRPSLDSRKRSRNDMDSGDDDNAMAGVGRGQQEDRDRGSSKRYHRDRDHHFRMSVDNHEDGQKPPMMTKDSS